MQNISDQVGQAVQKVGQAIQKIGQAVQNIGERVLWRRLNEWVAPPPNQSPSEIAKRFGENAENGKMQRHVQRKSD